MPWDPRHVALEPLSSPSTIHMHSCARRGLVLLPVPHRPGLRRPQARAPLLSMDRHRLGAQGGQGRQRGALPGADARSAAADRPLGHSTLSSSPHGLALALTHSRVVALQPPKRDLNAPDLYIPMCSLALLVTIHAVQQALSGAFTPATVNSDVSWLALVWVVQVCGCMTGCSRSRSLESMQGTRVVRRANSDRRSPSWPAVRPLLFPSPARCA